MEGREYGVEGVLVKGGGGELGGWESEINGGREG